jgi:aspartate aminotransferase
VLKGEPILRYAPPPGLRALRARVAERVRTRYDLPADESWVVVTAGASVALGAVIGATTEPGDEVLCPDPGFPAFRGLVQLFGRRLTHYPSAGADPAQDVADALSGSTRLVIWNSPSNPLGRVAPSKAVQRVAALARERGVALLSDEVYEDLVFEGEHTSPTPHAGPAAVSVYSFSKSFLLSGWRVGCAVAAPDLAAKIVRAHWTLAMSASSVAQHAAIGALGDSEAYLADRLEALRELRDEADALLRDRGLAHELPAGAHFFWLPIGETGLSSLEFVERCRTELAVSLAPGTAFGPSGEGFVRFSFGSPREEVLEGARRVGEWYARLAGDR